MSRKIYFHKSSAANLIAAFALLFLFSIPANAQHRGDNLAFQGLEMQNLNGVKPIAMGGAYTSMSGEVDALFWNPAGLAEISKIQIMFNANSYNKLWRERQDYLPNRQVVTMSFILDGLYTPKPEHNGWYDYDAFLKDSTYIVKDPVLGKNEYSEESADWQKELANSAFNNIAVALPLKLFKKSLVISTGYTNHLIVLDYDRNQTHLDPHPGTDVYGPVPERVVSPDDSLRINWSDYERQRKGPLHSFSAGFGYQIFKNLTLGLSMSRMYGQTDEFQALNKIGYFDLVEGYNTFRFSYDTLNVLKTGTSKFSSTKFNLGALFHLQNVTLGANITLPYTIKRDWNYEITTTTVDTTVANTLSGVDKLKIPLSFAFGIHISPRSNFTLAFDLVHKPYRNCDFSFAYGDSTHRGLPNQTSFGVGFEFSPIRNFSLLAGYRNVPQLFIPDGAADNEKGPVAQSYTIGASFQIAFGSFDVAYEFQQLKYYDVYFSNTNYAYEQFQKLYFGLTFDF